MLAVERPAGLVELDGGLEVHPGEPDERLLAEPHAANGSEELDKLLVALADRHLDVAGCAGVRRGQRALALADELEQPVGRRLELAIARRTSHR